MKLKHPMQLALIGIPFLLLSHAVQGKDESVTQVAETEEAAEEKGNARLAKEAEKRAKEADKLAKEAAKRAKVNTERAKEAAEKKDSEPIQEAEKTPADQPEDATESETTETPESPAINQGRGKAARAESDRSDRQNTQEQRQGRDQRERPATPAAPGTPATPATPATPPADIPVVPSDPLKTRDDLRPGGKDGLLDKNEPTDLTPDETTERDIVEIPASEPERLAETEVTEVTREVHRDLDQRKTKIGGREEARALIDDILGAESRISRAEIAREERFRPRFQRPGQDRIIEVSPDQRREATTYYQQRLSGREVEGPPPEFFSRHDRRGDRRVDGRVVERVEFVRPRYLNEGRRYVHYDSRASIPAILMAAQSMNYVQFQSAREVAPIFYEGQDVATEAMPLPPENYRNETSMVVSYPVDENSMISSEDILFLQGSTQFSDPYSYEVVGVMAAAMKALPEEDRFVIEGHASAEGSYESNMVLSQQRAEFIVREIVRKGVSPYRLLPVGYGESEARHPESAAEALRTQDRRVVVFRMKPEVAAAP